MQLQAESLEEPLCLFDPGTGIFTDGYDCKRLEENKTNLVQDV